MVADLAVVAVVSALAHVYLINVSTEIVGSIT